MPQETPDRGFPCAGNRADPSHAPDAMLRCSIRSTPRALACYISRNQTLGRSDVGPTSRRMNHDHHDFAAPPHWSPHPPRSRPADLFDRLCQTGRDLWSPRVGRTQNRILALFLCVTIQPCLSVPLFAQERPQGRAESLFRASESSFTRSFSDFFSTRAETSACDNLSLYLIALSSSEELGAKVVSDPDFRRSPPS